MTAYLTRQSTRHLGRFHGAACATMLTQDGVEQGVVMVWDRAIELRGPVGRRVFPRSIVHTATDLRQRGNDGIELTTGTGIVRVVGADLTCVRIGLLRWSAYPEAQDAARWDTPVFAGGPVWVDGAASRDAGTLVAGPDGLRFASGGAPERWAHVPWSAVERAGTGGLQTRSGRVFRGPGAVAVGAVWRALDLDWLDGRAALVAHVSVGWPRASHQLGVMPGGVVLVPDGRWARLWADVRAWPWSSIHALEGSGPDAFRVTTPSGTFRIEGRAAAGLLTELRRHRLAAALRDDEQARAAGRGSGGFVVQARTRPKGPRLWGRLRASEGRLVLDAGGHVHAMPLAAVRWCPGSTRHLSLRVSADHAEWTLRPVGGHRVLPDLARLLGRPATGPEVVDAADTAQPGRRAGHERRRDTRIPLAIDAWVDERGGVPDTAIGGVSHTVEVAMSSAVVRWTGPLRPGQEVGLALGLGGQPIPTRARVVREVREDHWAVVFVSPPGALVHRIGTRVRAWERRGRRAEKRDHIPLTAEG